MHTTEYCRSLLAELDAARRVIAIARGVAAANVNMVDRAIDSLRDELEVYDGRKLEA